MAPDTFVMFMCSIHVQQSVPYKQQHNHKSIISNIMEQRAVRTRRVFGRSAVGIFVQGNSSWFFELKGRRGSIRGSGTTPHRGFSFFVVSAEGMFKQVSQVISLKDPNQKEPKGCLRAGCDIHDVNECVWLCPRWVQYQQRVKDSTCDLWLGWFRLPAPVLYS